MNIWCISKYASLPKYGTAARLFYLAKEFCKNGHRTVLITSDSNHLAKFPDTNEKYNFENIEGVEVCWVKTRKYIKTASLARILSWLHFELGLFRLNRAKLPAPDVIVVSSLSLFTILYGLFLKKRYRVPLIFEVRDIWPLTLIEEGGVSKFHPLCLLMAWLEKIAYRHSNLVVGTMPKLDVHIKEVLGIERPFFCSPLGFEYEQYEKELSLEVEGLDRYFPENKRIVGYAGSMGVTNALWPFIKSIKQMNARSDVHFVIVGSGDLKGEFEDYLSKCENVTFVPRISQGEVPYFLSKCDLLYLSTHDSKVWEYGQSMNKVVQYMLSGKFVLASYSGYPSMLNEGGSGVFIPSHDGTAIVAELTKYLSLDQGELAYLGAKGKEWILKYRTYNILAEEYLDEIFKLTGRKVGMSKCT